MPSSINKSVITILTKPVTPPWVIAIVIVVNIAFSQIGNDSSPACDLKFENLHYSSSVSKNLGKDAIKMNILSICKSPQNYTDLTAEIYELINGQTTQVYKSQIQRVPSTRRNPNEAKFLEFWFICTRGDFLNLTGSASGIVQLSNKKTVSVSGSTGKYTSILCEPTAK